MTDTIARTIAALREFPVAVAAELYRLAPGRKPPNGDDILVLCDAAEASLRATNEIERAYQILEVDRQRHQRREETAVTDNLARSIAAPLERMRALAALIEKMPGGFTLATSHARDLFVICDAAERGLRYPPREPTQEMISCGVIVMSVTGGTLYDDVCAMWRAMWDAAPKINGGQGHEAAARCPTEGIAPSEATRLTADASGRMADATQRGQLGADAGSIPAPPTINEGGQDAATREDADGPSPELVPHPVPPSPSPAAPAPAYVPERETDAPRMRFAAKARLETWAHASRVQSDEVTYGLERTVVGSVVAGVTADRCGQCGACDRALVPVAVGDREADDMELTDHGNQPAPVPPSPSPDASASRCDKWKDSGAPVHADCAYMCIEANGAELAALRADAERLSEDVRVWRHVAQERYADYRRVAFPEETNYPIEGCLDALFRSYRKTGKYREVFCSECGRAFGANWHGYSTCAEHTAIDKARGKA
jgi:hypothetical protein